MSDNLVLQNTAVLSADGAKMNTAVQSGALRLPDLDARPPVRSFRIMPVAAPQKPLQLALKRMIDICGAFFGLLVLSPILLTICALIKLESRGPIFFRQLRTGRNEAPFEIFKFRSMYTDLCDNSGVRQTVSNDPRITRVGGCCARPISTSCRSCGTCSSAICRSSALVRMFRTCWLRR